jgi:hypothetical protein
MARGGSAWVGEWRALVERLITPSREGIRTASKLAIEHVKEAETVLQVRIPHPPLSLLLLLQILIDITAGQMRPPTAPATAELCGDWQVVIERLGELPPEQRVPLLFLVDAIVQVRRHDVMRDARDEMRDDAARAPPVGSTSCVLAPVAAHRACAPDRIRG